MKKLTQVLVFSSLLLCLTAGVAQGQWCDPNRLQPVDQLERNHRIIDARPDKVDKVRGRRAFKKRAQVAIINMNPFMFRYDVKVEQTEIEDRAQLDFLKLLGAPITDLAGIASFRAVATSQDAEALQAGGDLERLIALTGGPPPPVPPPPAPSPHLPPPPPATTCSVENTALAYQALNYLSAVRDAMLRKKDEIDADLVALRAAYVPSRNAYLNAQDIIYSPTSDSTSICTTSNNLMAAFVNPASPYPTRMQLNDLKRKIADLEKLIQELKESATTFSGDTTFGQCQARSNGFDYAKSLIRLAVVMEEYRKALNVRAQSMTDETKAYDFLARTIRSFADLNAAGVLVAGIGPGMKLLQNTFDITGEFDVSQLDIELIPTALQPLKPFNEPGDIDAFRARARSEQEFQNDSGRVSQQIRGTEVVTVGDLGDGGGPQPSRTDRVVRSSDRAQSRRVRVNPFANTDPAEEEEPGASIRTKANATIGSRRFELSGGMAYSTLNRREFQPVLGFARDANGQIVDAEGKPTDKRELSTIVGISESSKSRFSPLVMLNTRLTNNPKYNLFFSVGVTAKKDSAGTDVEYLIGPSFNFLNKNVFFTFGAYAGKQQKLAGDLFEGARLSDTTIPIQKEYKWAPAFSFTYRIPVGSGSSR
jgi:hypothetical protein